jgi:hypothetical protein
MRHAGLHATTWISDFGLRIAELSPGSARQDKTRSDARRRRPKSAFRTPIGARLAGAALLLLFGCRDNPFEDAATVAPPGRTLSGTIHLPDQTTHEGVYVWLDGLGVGTSTDKEGRFTLTLPSAEQLGGGAPVNGVFPMYYYLGNYAIASSRIAIRNGLLALPTTEFDEQGAMREPRDLTPLFTIETTLSLKSIEKDSLRFITIHVRMRTPGGSVHVYYPRKVNNVEGPIFFRNIETGNVILLSALVNGWVPSDETDIGPVWSERIYALTVQKSTFPMGLYEVIPYLLYKAQYVPPSLFNSLGTKVQELVKDFVRIPYRRQGDLLRVRDNIPD